MASGYPEAPADITALDPQLVCYSWMTGIDAVQGRPHWRTVRMRTALRTTSTLVLNQGLRLHKRYGG